MLLVFERLGLLESAIGLRRREQENHDLLSHAVENARVAALPLPLSAYRCNGFFKIVRQRELGKGPARLSEISYGTTVRVRSFPSPPE